MSGFEKEEVPGREGKEAGAAACVHGLALLKAAVAPAKDIERSRFHLANQSGWLSHIQQRLDDYAKKRPSSSPTCVPASSSLLLQWRMN